MNEFKIYKSIPEIDKQIENIMKTILGNNSVNISPISFTNIIDELVSLMIIKYVIENNKDKIDQTKPLHIIYLPGKIEIHAKYLTKAENNIDEQWEGWSYNYNLI